MKRYPLHTLLKLRAHRSEKARAQVIEAQRAVRACQDECTRISQGIDALSHERHGQRQRLLDAPAPGQPWPVVLAQRQAHVDLLGEHIVAAQHSLAQAQERLGQAERGLDEARQAYFKAKAREDALEKRRGLWHDEQRALHERMEEDVAADLLQARHARPGQP